MCGIAGYFGKHLISKANINRTLQKMRQRGPDFSNYFSKSYPNNLFIYLFDRRSIYTKKVRICLYEGITIIILLL